MTRTRKASLVAKSTKRRRTKTLLKNSSIMSLLLIPIHSPSAKTITRRSNKLRLKVTTRKILKLELRPKLCRERLKLKPQTNRRWNFSKTLSNNKK